MDSFVFLLFSLFRVENIESEDSGILLFCDFRGSFYYNFDVTKW